MRVTGHYYPFTKESLRLAEKDEERRAELIEAIRNGSVATWKHFNLHGGV